MENMSGICFFVPGNPKGLKRHRTFRTKAGFSVQVDASKADKADFLALAMAHRPAEPIREPVTLTAVCVFARPKSHFRRDGSVKPDAPKWYPSTPDWDNVGKWIGDALNGTFWHDDRLIVVGKVYAVYGAVPGVAVEIQPPTEIEYQHALSLVGSVRRNT